MGTEQSMKRTVDRIIISRQQLKDLMMWAFVSGKNDVYDGLFKEAIRHSLNDLFSSKKKGRSD